MVLIARAAAIALVALMAASGDPDRLRSSVVRSVSLAAQRPPGAIRGKVEFRRAVSLERRPGVADLGAPVAPRADLRGPAIVYLETAPSGAFEERESGRARMDQRNETFVPHVLAVTVGTTVDFPNNDRTYHNVFSLSKTKRFDLGRYAAGRSRPVLFDRPGVVRVFCDIHSHMNAYIVVFSHRFFSLTDAEGRYRIDRVPPGTYTLVAWNEGEARDVKQTTVPENAVVELDFAIR